MWVDVQLDDWVLCRIYKKSTSAQRTGKERENSSCVEEVKYSWQSLLEVLKKWSCWPWCARNWQRCQSQVVSACNEVHLVERIWWSPSSYSLLACPQMCCSLLLPLAKEFKLKCVTPSFFFLKLQIKEHEFKSSIASLFPCIVILEK